MSGAQPHVPPARGVAPAIVAGEAIIAVVDVVELKGETLKLDVAERLRGPARYTRGARVAVACRLDPEDRTDAWRAVDLRPGGRFFLAALATTDPSVWTALAIEPLGAAPASAPAPPPARGTLRLDHPDVAAAREAVALAAAVDPPPLRRPRVQQALVDPSQLLRACARLLVTRDWGRDDATETVAAAAADVGAPLARRAWLAFELMDAPFLDTARGADRANVRIVDALARGALAASGEARLPWARAMNPCLRRSFAADAAVSRRISQALLHQVDVDPAAVAEALDELAPLAEHEAPIIADLAARWREAAALRAKAP